MTLDERTVLASSSLPLDQPTRIDELISQLKPCRLGWKTAHGDEPFPGTVVVEFDRDTPTVLFKSVFRTSFLAGYPNVLVRGLDNRREPISLGADIPPPPNPSFPPSTVLHAYVTGKTVRLTWRRGEATLSESIESLVGLAESVCKQWGQYGVHRDKSDRASDLATLHLPNDEPLAVLLPVVESLLDCKRLYDGEATSQPVFSATFAASD
ncbi:MAG: hypothetical protein U0271_37545 [Polyangiaceae bacterium]